MPTITFDAISKSYGTNKVITEFTADVADKDFLVLLGPSGCGKSTMLRMIAGLTDITHGKLKFDGVVVNDQSPKQRNIAFVFQSYALYPHMSVRANIAFPLIMDENKWWHHLPIAGSLARRAIMRRADIVNRVDQVAEMLELSEYLDRRPKALSGGQRQRVALARSLIREPALYLLDEPLSNLDAKLRTQMRAEISRLHDRVQKTFIYVTHDQVEAMTMGTKIIVLNGGVVQQYASPKELYSRPANVFVAKFIGSPPMNLFDADVTEQGLRVAAHTLDDTGPIAIRLRQRNLTQIIVGIRPENTALLCDEPTGSANAFAATATTVEDLGAETVVGFTLNEQEIPSDDKQVPNSRIHHAKAAPDVALKPGSPCWVKPATASAVLFEPETGRRVDL